MIFRKILFSIKWLFSAAQCRHVINKVRNECLTYLDKDALLDLFETVKNLQKHNKHGVLIEAGCALGGSAIVIASAKQINRKFYIYDVFGIIPAPTDKDDADVHDRYKEIKSGQSKGLGSDKYYGYEENLFGAVKSSFERFDLPTQSNNVILVKGLFQDTIDINEPVLMAHIDGDWYESVMVCLTRITPKLVVGGVLIIDDYFAWSGCRKAVDDFFGDKKNEFEFKWKARLHIVRRKI